MIDPEDQQLISEFLEAVRASPLSDEAIARRVGGNPSGPTIRRYRRGEIPKDRIDPETRTGMLAFVTSHEDRILGEASGAPSSFSERVLRLLERESRQAEDRASAAKELAVAARLEAENARDRQRALTPRERADAISGAGESGVVRTRRRQGQPSADTPAPGPPGPPGDATKPGSRAPRKN